MCNGLSTVGTGISQWFNIQKSLHGIGSGRDACFFACLSWLHRDQVDADIAELEGDPPRQLIDVGHRVHGSGSRCGSRCRAAEVVSQPSSLCAILTILSFSTCGVSYVQLFLL